jgi:hypothetical protein
MAFPNDPTTGTTHGINDRAWLFNGYAWQRYDTTPNEVYSINGITGAIGLTAGIDVSIKITGKTFTISSETLYGVSGAIYASNLATGLLHGGIISINAGNTATFDITAGRGQIHASGSTYTRDPLPTLNYVSWSGQTGITVTNLATSDTTWLYIDGSGVLNQRTEYYTDDQIENTIIIGQLVHPSRTFINLSRTNPNVAYATDKQYEQFIRAFGPIKVSGHTITANGANLKLNRSSGKAFSLGRNWINNTDDPSVVSDAARTDCIFYRYYRGATVGTFVTVPNQTVIDPAYYDNGSGVLQAVPGGKYTIQRIFYYPNTPTLLGVYYGRNTYVSLAEAAANLNLEDFSEIENTRTNAVFAAYLVVKSNATSLLNTSDALIIQAGSFRSTSSSGGSVSLTIDDLTDVIISSPQNYQVLTYVDGLTGWENRSVSTLPLVSSINGISGPVGISAGSNITITQSGNTFTFSSNSSGGGTKTYEVFTPLHNQPPASNYATVDTRNSIMVLEFDAATDESAVFVGVIPEAASLGSGLKIRIHWMADTATSGTCRWGVQIERMNTDEDSDSFDTAATAGSTTNGTSGIITTTEITITTIDSVAAGESYRLKVFRDADGTSGTDDMTGDAQLVAVEVRSAS